MATVEELKKKIVRYKTLLAERQKTKAPAERLRLFKKKVKRFQRRLGKIAPAKNPAEAAAATAEEKKPEAKEEKKG